jgi:hypothetical protein
MKVSELITELQKVIHESGDLVVASTGYYGTMEVTGLELGDVVQWPVGVKGQSLSPGKIVPGCILLPGNFP